MCRSNSIELIRLNAYDGPNVFGPLPGVLMLVRCDQDRSQHLRAALKDAALAVGLIIAQLEIETQPREGEVLIAVRFGTEAPSIGADLAAYVVDGIAAEAVGAANWDYDTPLQTIRARRRAEELPIAAVQLIAEARARGLPSFVRSDGSLQLGYGCHCWICDPQPLRERGAVPPLPPWERLGAIPIIAVTGGSGRAAAVQRLAAEVAANGASVQAIDGADFATTRVALADPASETLVVGLATADLLRRGLPFDRCDLAVITDCAGPRPPEAADDEEWLRALGLPMLLSPRPAQINLADAALLPLLPYAPNGVVGW